MIKKFNNTSLTDLMLQKQKKIQNNSEFDVFFAGYEKIFSKSQKNIIYLLFKERKNQQILMDQLLKFIIFLKIWIMIIFFLINACMPFLKVSTIMKLIKICKKENKPCFGVFTTKNFFINQKNKSINFKKKFKSY